MNSLEFIFDDTVYPVQLDKQGDSFKVISGEKEYLFVPAGEDLYTVTINGIRHLAAMKENKGAYFIDIDSMLFELKEPSSDGFAGGESAHGEKDKIFAPMPGKIVKILVTVGQEIKEKQPMVIVEAMKMENQVNAKAAGVVKAINFKDGDQVDTESAIIELELNEE